MNFLKLIYLIVVKKKNTKPKTVIWDRGIITWSNPHFLNTSVGLEKKVNNKLSFDLFYLVMFIIGSKAATYTQWAFVRSC